jgi:putative transcriptional regulator
MKGGVSIVKMNLISDVAAAAIRKSAAAEPRNYDDDLPPMTEEELSRVKTVPRIKTLRRVLKLTQEEFSKRYGIPLGTLRDWEQGAKEPDTTAKSYIRAIMGNPEAVAKAFREIPQAPGQSGAE